MKKEIQFIEKLLQENNFLSDICAIIENGGRRAYAEVSSVMIETHWNICKRIVKQEQQGKTRADYGKQLVIYHHQRWWLEMRTAQSGSF